MSPIQGTTSLNPRANACNSLYLGFDWQVPNYVYFRISIKAFLPLFRFYDNNKSHLKFVLSYRSGQYDWKTVALYYLMTKHSL